MTEAAPHAVHLSDYAPYPFVIDGVELTFRLDPGRTRVISRIAFSPNPDGPGHSALQLDGERLKLIWARIDGAPVEPRITPEGLTCDVPTGSFVWEAEVEVDPAANTALEGLYMSNGMYCTQCEAQGFRRITYYPDRPDVMARFEVTIESDAPVRLSNGNPQEPDAQGRARWSDPWPKPAYLFALVAGNLTARSASFTTRSGREVALNVYVRPGDEDRCDYALDALIRSMRWDEEVYGREYDLDVFNIVAVDDFNMGAMENKGLNIFNSKYVLASPQTATDRDYEMIEGIIAHEYFHNWTGNRITCRDWFQLCLKEGLTVFRDQQFTGDMRSAPVKRIEDVLQLRARQFREDAGPLSHPVRPESYIEINNFYTATVYEKGAEVIGMLRRLVGAEAYDKALALYFDRHDGQACTIEDWLKVFEDATGRDLTQFKRWYTQSGTPHLRVLESWEDGTYSLHLQQQTPPTPGQPEKAPQVIPVAVGLLDPGGREVVPTRLLELTQAEQSFSFEGLSDRPVPSLLRGFSAPVVIERASTAQERALLLAHDTDPFNRWEAGRALAKELLVDMISNGTDPGDDYPGALGKVIEDEGLDPAFRALTLALPSEDDIAQTLKTAGITPDPMAVHEALNRLAVACARHLRAPLAALHDALAPNGPYTPDAEAAGRRSLRGAALGLLTRIDDGSRAEAQFAQADNMTEELGALTALLRAGKGHEQLAQFERKWSQDRLVMDKWFSVQVMLAAPREACEIADRLTAHPAFDWKNPNRFRAVLGGLAANHAGFHAPGGAAYALAADWLIRLDPVNPQTTARMSTMFETWRRYDADRQDMMRAALERLAAAPGVSRDTGEMVGRMLG
ncbi:aminopeptidase N [Profundibacterium mesophilum]|uniref:Aminopeptidase N n=1 Tax=Profundibacterium mesophilum KAUST100406-0324 TaxID=1037889 RepID=A0A921NWS7_9RHOB|nr:aminopeptidase N [Profundibacterium mesophilum]KAF0674978.1 Aminopeptidase N [Profundibacterium mesophilum KAUST100406-0324]